MHDQSDGHGRLRYAAMGALAALAAVGAIAVTGAFAAKPQAKPQPAVPATGATKTPTGPMPIKTQAPPPPVDHQPFLDAIQQLVNAGTITATQGQVVDQEIVAGRVDTDTLASSGFTASQLQAVQQALGSAKGALASSANPPGRDAAATRRAGGSAKR